MELTSTYSDNALIESLRGNRDTDPVIRYLYRQHFDSLRNYIEQNSGSREDAEDIFQEVLLGFIELVRMDKFRGESSIKTLLFAMNRNTWLNELKRRGRSLAREKIFEKNKDWVDQDTSEVIAGREARNQVLKVVEQLGDTCKKILLGFYYENLSMAELLTRTGYENEQVVRNKKYKCLKSLEQMLSANPSLAQSLKNALHYE